MTAGDSAVDPYARVAGVDAPPGRLLVAMSGGADSALAAWAANQTGRPTRAIHINHATEASDDLASAALATAAAIGIDIEVCEVQVAPGPSWEGKARDARWDALWEAASDDETIVTGHHRDDLAETVLANLFRGAGAAGLAAMAAARNRVWRPLLGWRREDVRSAAVQLDLPFVDDPTNSDTSFQRNRLRHETIPQLAATTPHLVESLARAAASIAADDALLEAEAADLATGTDPWGAVRMAAAALSTAPPPIAARGARRLLRAARPPYPGSSGEIALVLDVANGARQAADLEGGITVEREGPWLVAHRGDAAPPNQVPLEIPGEADFGRLEVIAALPPSGVVRRTALVDVAAVGRRVTLRSAAAGERIEIGSGTKLIRDVLMEAEVPRRIRPAWPVVVAHGRIAAVAGIRSSPWARGALGEDGTFEIAVREKA